MFHFQNGFTSCAQHTVQPIQHEWFLFKYLISFPIIKQIPFVYTIYFPFASSMPLVSNYIDNNIKPTSKLYIYFYVCVTVRIHRQFSRHLHEYIELIMLVINISNWCDHNTNWHFLGFYSNISFVDIRFYWVSNMAVYLYVKFRLLLSDYDCFVALLFR